MSYRIEYGPAVPPRYVKKKPVFRLQVMTALWLLVFSLGVRQFFPAGVEKLRSLVLPTAPGVTQTALNGFMGNLRNGETFGDSFTAFCVYIIEHDAAHTG